MFNDDENNDNDNHNQKQQNEPHTNIIQRYSSVRTTHDHEFLGMNGVKKNLLYTHQFRIPLKENILFWDKIE